MELRHFSHNHPLIYNEEPNKDYGGLLCDGCEEQILGPNYSCKQCSWFILHKSCAELPLELDHPMHPKHPLHLNHRYSWEMEIKCDGCNTEVLWGFFYHCPHCNFSLESKCASLPLTVEAEIHAHPLTLVRRSNCFTCDACGKEGKGMFYICAICPFLVHIQCSSQPLNLANSLQESTSMLKCEDLGLDESIDSLTYVVKKSKLGEDNVEIAEEIEHFSHEHDLKLIDEQLEKEDKCDGCMWPICPPFYTCTQCKFFLHKSCVELPRKKSHPLHRHPLTLLPEPPRVPSFSCYACGRDCNGFVYRCDKCNFDLDVRCSSISDIFTHEGHFHRLFLSRKSYSGKCSSCNSEGLVFRCGAGCKFALDFKCATLPPTVRYNPYEDPYEETFLLSFEFEDDYHDQYDCDICGRERVRNRWFYYCMDGLTLAAHPRCILGKYPYIKFGRTYTFDMHQHPLTFVDKSKGLHPPCDKCGHSCRDSTKVFSLKQHYGKETWESYGHFLGSWGEEEPVNLVFQSQTAESNPNSTCWPVIDSLLLKSVGTLPDANDNLLPNGGFETGPDFLSNSTEGILLDENPSAVQSPLRPLSVLGSVKYIDSKHFFVPQGNTAIEIVSGVSAGIQTAVILKEGFKYNLEFTLGDANDTCVGDFIVGAQAGSTTKNFSLASNGTGSAKKFSVAFMANPSTTPISFLSYTTSQTRDGVHCGPVVDDVVLRASYGLKLEMQLKVLISLFIVGAIL